MQRKRDNAPDTHLLARFLDAPAVDANVAMSITAWARVRLFTNRMQWR